MLQNGKIAIQHYELRVNIYISFQSVLENILPVMSFKDLTVDSSPSLGKDVQLFFKQGSIR